MGLAELLIGLDLLVAAMMFWGAALRRWRMAVGSLLVLAGSLPLLRPALVGEFRLGALLILITSVLGGGALLVADFLDGSGDAP